MRKNKTRYYLHGDLTEHDPGLYFCVRCDTFEAKDHFQDGRNDHGPSRLTNSGYFRYGKKMFYGHGAVGFRKKYQRDRDAENLFG